jgi:hypothetical protein
MLGITPVMEQRTVSMDPIFLRQSSVYGGIRVSLEGIGAFGKKFNLRISESGKPEVEDVTSEGIITSAMSEESTKIATEILH